MIDELWVLNGGDPEPEDSPEDSGDYSDNNSDEP